MYFNQFYLGCLAHASYMIGSDGEAAVIDPQRDVDIYLDEARQHGLSIKHVIETHLHADFVSGHRELSSRTGARIYFGAKAEAKFEHVPVREGHEIRFGSAILRMLETPGHTPESISVLVIDREKSEEPDAVLTGDALFIGDVGRPDLVGSKMSAVELAGLLYESLHEKLLKLPDHVKVYPAHGAGSLCGRNISSERSSTIGQERRFNYALKKMPREEFVRMMTVDLPEAPSYFKLDAEMNRSGPPLLGQLPTPTPLSPQEVERKRNEGFAILDTRPAPQYGTAHIPGSLNIGLSGQFASWAGALIEAGTPLILLGEDEESVREARTRLARVGLENIAGYLAGGILEWDRAGLTLARVEQISAEELRARLADPDPPRVLDVRRPLEWQAGHIPAAIHIPLHELSQKGDALDKETRVAVICAGGYRSSIGTSILERLGFKQVTNVIGGMAAYRIDD